MKQTFVVLLMAASTVAASAQTPAQPAPAAKPAAPATAVAAKPATPAAAAKASTAKPAAPAVKAAPTTPPTVAVIIKAPASIPPVKGLQKPLFTLALRYQDVKVGTGVAAEPGKLLKCKFTLWLAADGAKFDSTDDHPGPPQKDKDGKPVLGDDGKPKLGDPQPMGLVMGQGRPLPGWDMGSEGMKVGGKRRVFIPWQLGFGAHEIPSGAGHGLVPAKSDLILDIELTDVTDAPQRPGMGPGMSPGMHPMPGAHPMPMPGAAQPAAPAPGAMPMPKAAAPATPAAPAAAPAPATAPAAPTPAAPAQPPSK